MGKTTVEEFTESYIGATNFIQEEIHSSWIPTLGNPTPTARIFNLWFRRLKEKEKALRKPAQGCAEKWS
jgi:hypothetical protein